MGRISVKAHTFNITGVRETSVKYRARSIRSRVYFVSPAMEKSVDLVPALVTFLAAAHVIALVYWIYRLASDRQPPKQKPQ
ncbi:unnamed protein product [Brassica oleracea]